jgi:hypothetical protein
MNETESFKLLVARRSYHQPSFWLLDSLGLSGVSVTGSRELPKGSPWATAFRWLLLPIWLVVCWVIYTLVQYLFGVDLTTEMVLHALASPFVALSAALDVVVSAFLRLPLIGQIIIVVAVALWIIARIVDNAVRRIREDK